MSNWNSRGEERKNGQEKKRLKKIWMDKYLKLIFKKASNLLIDFAQTMKPHQRQPCSCSPHLTMRIPGLLEVPPLLHRPNGQTECDVGFLEMVSCLMDLMKLVIQ